jgi:hypothetical protein
MKNEGRKENKQDINDLYSFILLGTGCDIQEWKKNA